MVVLLRLAGGLLELVDVDELDLVVLVVVDFALDEMLLDVAVLALFLEVVAATASFICCLRRRSAASDACTSEKDTIFFLCLFGREDIFFSEMEWIKGNCWC